MHWLAKSMQVSPSDVIEMEFVDYVIFCELEMEFNREHEKRMKEARRKR